jgi:hypothetical protein
LTESAPPETREGEPSPDIATPQTVRTMQVNFDQAADLWAKAEKFLIQEFAR